VKSAVGYSGSFAVGLLDPAAGYTVGGLWSAADSYLSILCLNKAAAPYQGSVFPAGYEYSIPTGGW
jgi:hypothetical protein